MPLGGWADRSRRRRRLLRERWADYCAGRITFAEFDASVQGWINHVRYADTWRLRQHVLGQGLTYDREP